MALTLITGPANAGKVARLLRSYLEALPRDPILIVPNRSDVERVERELLRMTPALIGGTICTFDDVFESIGTGDGGARAVVSEAQRRLVIERALRGGAASAEHGRARLERSGGFVDSLVDAIVELESGLLEPPDVPASEIRERYGAYREELDRLGVLDRELARGRAAERAERELDAWRGRPVFAYGFEDLTGVQRALLHALAGRAEVTVSLAYEPARPSFDALRDTAEGLAALAGGHIEELPPASAHAAPALAHLERALFADREHAEAPPLDGAVRFLEGAGVRGTAELAADEALTLLRAGVPAEDIAFVCPTLEGWRGPLETALTTLGVPFAAEGRVRWAQTPFGHAALSLLRFAWLEGARGDLFRFLRSPYSGLARAHVDYLEGRLRGRSVTARERVEEEVVRHRGKPIPLLERVRTESALDAVGVLSASMLRGAYGLDTPPVGDAATLDLRAHEAVAELLDDLSRWTARAGPVSREQVVAALERLTVRLPGVGEPGRVAVLDLPRARTRRFQVLFVLGLEEGGLPTRSAVSPFLDEHMRGELEARAWRAGLSRRDPLARQRYLFYAACTRPSRRLYLVRQAASDEGARLEAGPFWNEARSCFAPDDVERWTRRRRLSGLVWPLEHAPTERERLRAVAALTAADGDVARALARANGWERRLERAASAFERPTQLSHPAVLEELRARSTFSVTELESFADCSSIWLVERLVDPRSIDAEADARLRGSVAHQVLYRLFAGLPKRIGSERVEPERLEETLVFLRECLDEVLASQIRLDLPEVALQELEQTLARDLEHFLRQEAESTSRLVPRRFEVSFGSERSAPELQRGLDLGTFALSGKIDRIDVDPFSARGIVQDYKSGKQAHSATKIDSELRLQIPLYVLVLRDLVGIEPLGGLYRALAGERHARGLLRSEARQDGIPGFARSDYLDEDAFWAQVERAQDHARGFVERIRAGDVRHDPRGGPPCPRWCELAPMCRVARQ